MISNIFDVSEIEEKLGVSFKNKVLLRTAFTHSSYANEKKLSSNENLEFLGDSLLNFTVAEYLFQKYPTCTEGELSQMRIGVISEKPLAAAVERLGIGAYVYLGVGENKAKGGAGQASIYSDLFEAVTAAIYLDSDLASAKKFILTSLKDNLGEKIPTKIEVDCKTKLQEYVQRTKGSKLRYELVERRGPDHSPEFVFAVLIDEKPIGSGNGKNKREAQQRAAENALKKLKVIE